MPCKVISLILGGGRGTRLYPLTKLRSKPAVPIGGKYRLIDIPISNCIHSGLNRIFVVTQFNSNSLHQHIQNTYKFDAFGQGFVEILAAQQTMEHESWYQGTADAVRRNILHFNEPEYDQVLILSGDQLYRMNYHEMIRTHQESRADITIAVLPVHERDVHGFGIMKIDPTGRVEAFTEKPRTAEARAAIRTDPEWMEKHGIPSRGRAYLASMGIYLFGRQLLVDMLEHCNDVDFGKELFPQAIRTHRVQAHLFDDYWEDIGTIGAFHKANIDLTLDDPPFNFLDQERPIFSRARNLGGSQIRGATIDHSLIAGGTIIGKGAVIENSVIGVRSQIGENVVIRDSYVMGNDFYKAPPPVRGPVKGVLPVQVGIGAGSRIENAIIDKNAEHYGRLKTPEWERWFTRRELEGLLARHCRRVESRFISYWEDVEPDGLFIAWTAER